MERTTLRAQWIERFVAWAKAREDLRAALLVGSMGSIDHPADEWSDVDLLFITAKPATYTTDDAWMKQIAPFWAGVLPPGETFGGWLPLQCGFSAYGGGLVVDYFILSSARTKLALPLIRFLNRFPALRRWLPESMATLGADLGDLLRDGARILFDQDSLAERLREAALAIPARPPAPPSQRQFQTNVDDFWIGPPRIVADLRRGRVMSAMKTLEITRRDLLKMAEWRARAKNNWKGDDLAYRPARIEAWADPRVKELLPRLYAGYNADEIWDALFALLEVFPWLAAETADMLGYSCPPEAERIIDWVEVQYSLLREDW